MNFWEKKLAFLFCHEEELKKTLFYNFFKLFQLHYTQKAALTCYSYSRDLVLAAVWVNPFICMYKTGACRSPYFMTLTQWQEDFPGLYSLVRQINVVDLPSCTHTQTHAHWLYGDRKVADICGASGEDMAFSPHFSWPITQTERGKEDKAFCLAWQCPSDTAMGNHSACETVCVCACVCVGSIPTLLRQGTPQRGHYYRRTFTIRAAFLENHACTLN